jgi:hypothetical protein
MSLSLLETPVPLAVRDVGMSIVGCPEMAQEGRRQAKERLASVCRCPHGPTHKGGLSSATQAALGLSLDRRATINRPAARGCRT